MPRGLTPDSGRWVLAHNWGVKPLSVWEAACAALLQGERDMKQTDLIVSGSAASRGSLRTAAIAAVAGLCIASTHAMAAPPLYSLQRLGLTGSAYSTSGNYSGSITGITSTGKAYGSTNRFASNVANGRDTWYFNGTTNIQIGLIGGVYEQSNGFRQGTVTGFNDASLLGGFSTRYLNGTSTSIGQDAWVYNGATNSQVQVGFTSGIYVSPASSNSQRSSNVSVVSANNLVIGSSTRYLSTTTGATPTTEGTDVWVYNPSTLTTTAINPGNAGTPIAPPVGSTGATGVTYTRNSDGMRNVSVLGANSNATGQIVGTTSRYSAANGALGTDVWFFDGTTTTILGLSNANNFNAATGAQLGSRTSSIPVTNAINNNGQVIGTTLRYNAANVGTATDAWVYTPGSGGGTYAVMGLTGGVYSPVISGNSAGTQVSTPSRINSFGKTIGTTNRYTAGTFTQIGQDAFYFDGASTVKVSPTTATYVASDNTASSGASAISNSATPFIVGSSSRWLGQATTVNSGLGFGTDVWIYNSGASSPAAQTIGLFGAAPSAGSITVTYTKADNTQNGTFRGYNDAGFVIGSAVRYDANGFSIGSAGWLYNVNTQTTTSLLFPTNFGNDTAAGHIGGLDLATTTPTIVTGTGNVLGTYIQYDAAGASQGNRVFAWSSSDGFSDLGGLVSGGLSAAGWDRLSNLTFQQGSAAGGYPMYLAGSGRLIGETADGSLYLATAVPAPATGGLLALGLAVAAKRRRR